MSDFSRRDQYLLVEVESPAGTEASPAAADDAVEIGNLVFNPTLDVDDGTAMHTGSIDAARPVLLGGAAAMSFFTRLRGSGTQGTAPRAGKLLRGCGLDETAQGGAITNTAQAGGNNTITLAAGESATDDIHIGKPISLTGGTGSGQSAVIIDYDGTTKIATVHKDWTVNPDATTTYNIPDNVLYSPISLDQERVTIWAYQNSNQAAVNSERRKVIGGMGNAVITFGPRSIPQVAFVFSGQLEKPTNVARPTGVVFDTPLPPAYLSAESIYNGAALKFSELSIDLGNTIGQDDDPAQAYGRDISAATARRIVLSATPNMVLQSTHDFWGDAVGGTVRHMVQQWGGTDGNKITITMPTLYHDQAPGESERNNFAKSPIRAHAAGADSGLFVCFH